MAMPTTRAQYFAEAIDSALSQTFADTEILVVNNGADPDVARMVRLRTDARIRYFESNERLGIIQNWNRCLELARGELFVLFSDDDIYDPGFVDALVDLADRIPSTNVFHARLRLIDRHGHLLRNFATAPEWESCLSFIWHRLTFLRHHVAPDFLCRTAALRALGGFVDFPLAWNSDNATWFALAKSGGVGYTSRAACNMRVSGLNLSLQGDPLLKYRADCAFADWLGTLLDDVRPADSIERELLSEVRHRLRDLPRHSQLGLLLPAHPGSRMGDAARVLAHWIRRRRQFSIPVRTFLKAEKEALTRVSQDFLPASNDAS